MGDQQTINENNVNEHDNKTFLKKNQKFLLIILIPLISSIVPLLFRSQQANCAFVLIVMSIYWTTECLPIGVTSLIPIVLFPLFGIISSKVITRGYFQDIILLFFGGLVMANAIEITGLHERISLKVLTMFGSNPKWLLLGFMTISAFMSLWISNAAVCSMMLPMINAVVKQLVKNDSTYHLHEQGASNHALEASSIELNKLSTKLPTPTISISDFSSTAQLTPKSKKDDYEDLDDEDSIIRKSEKARKMATGFLLACSYSSTIGGLGSLVGTAPNILLKGFFDEWYPNAGVSFLTFTMFAFPVSVILIMASWLWITVLWLPREYLFGSFKKDAKIDEKSQHIKDLIIEKYEGLGPTTWDQKCVGVSFLTLVILWITRDFQGIFGWGLLFNPKFVSDATPAVLAVLVLFACPKKNIFLGHEYEHLIKWKSLQEIFPWNVILLIGGGLAVAEGFQSSGLSHFIGERLKALMSDKKEITLLIILVISATATEFTSNTSISSIFIPIVNSIAIELNISPVYLLLPLILSVSLAFMLPVATPNNALIFANGYVKMKDMITTGLVMNIIGLLTVYLAANTWLGLIFDLKPLNMAVKNATAIKIVTTTATSFINSTGLL